MLRVRHAPVRYVHGDHPDSATRSGDRPRLRTREARRTGESHHHVIQTHTRDDRDSVPRRLAVNCDGIPAVLELVAEQVEERIVSELGLLQADDVRPPLIQPRQQPRHALLDRVDVPGRDSHRPTVLAPPTAALSPTRQPLRRIVQPSSPGLYSNRFTIASFCRARRREGCRDSISCCLRRLISGLSGPGSATRSVDLQVISSGPDRLRTRLQIGTFPRAGTAPGTACGRTPRTPRTPPAAGVAVRRMRRGGASPRGRS